VGIVLYVLFGFVTILLLAGVVLRLRKLARDKSLRASIGVDPRPRHSPPPAHEPVKSFRRLEPGESASEYVIETPRIDPVKRQFFDDGEDRYDQMPEPGGSGRHSNDWLLDRSHRRSDPVRRLVLLILAVVVALAGCGVAWYVLHHHPVHH